MALKKNERDGAMDTPANDRPFTQPLTVIYADIDQRVHAITEARPDWLCHKGCAGCCRRLAEVPAITAAEWQVLQQGLAMLPPATQHQIAERLQALAQAPRGPITCPFLDDTDGTCLVYAQRPATCRMYGFYVSRTAHWWCDDIQTQYEAGISEGLILGNQDAIDRTLQRQYGEAKSVLDWWAQRAL
jgi:Fe-S-cluster containining protein